MTWWQLVKKEKRAFKLLTWVLVKEINNSTVMQGQIHSQLHYMAKLFWTPDHYTYMSSCWTSHSKIMAINTKLHTIFNSLHYSGKSFQKILERVCGDFCPFSQKSSCQVKYWCWISRPCPQLVFQFIPKGTKVLIWVEATAFCRPL